MNKEGIYLTKMQKLHILTMKFHVWLYMETRSEIDIPQGVIGCVPTPDHLMDVLDILEKFDMMHTKISVLLSLQEVLHNKSKRK